MSNDFTLDLIFNAFNEIESIEKDIKDIVEQTLDIKTLTNIIIVEDGSTDGTTEHLKTLSSDYPIILNQSKKRRGYSKALIDGINSSNAEFIFFSDLGGKFDWSEIKKLSYELPNYDFVVGVRTNREDQIYRQLLTKAYSKYIKIFYGVESNDPDSGFRIYRNSLIKDILKDELFNKHLLNSEFTIKCLKKNAKFKEVEINYKRREGQSRGLPLKIIPTVIVSTIKNSFKIKKQVKKYDK